MFQLKNLVRTAFKSILRNRMRSLLTSLGIIIGVAAVIVMVAIGKGAQARIEAQISSLGTNLLIVFPGTSQFGGVSRGAGSANRFTMDDAEKLVQETTLLKAVSPIVRSGAQIIGGGKNWNTAVYGVADNYLSIKDWKLEYGDFFSERDLRSRKKVAVLGQTVANQLFPGEDPVGERIRIRNTPFDVIGVLDAKGQSVTGQDQDDVIIAPATTVLYHLKGGAYIDMIYASASSTDQMYQAQEEIRQAMRTAHRLQPGEDDDFTIRNQEDIIQTAAATTKTMTILLGGIAAVSLVVGGIGIMNIMLVSVTERTREIGIRLSVGARSSDILTQFLTEAVVLSLTGGVIGILVSFSISIIMNQFTSLKTVISPGVVFLAVTFSAAVGVFFGFHPARKAAALNPIDALRYE
jgi:putative ABC transport system permease protein